MYVDSPDSSREKGWKDYFAKHPNNFIAAYSTSKGLIGTCVIFSDERKAGIYRLAVAPEWRKKGIGKKIVNEAERRAKELGLKGVYALVDKRSPASQALFSGEQFEMMSDVLYYTKSL